MYTVDLYPPGSVASDPEGGAPSCARSSQAYSPARRSLLSSSPTFPTSPTSPSLPSSPPKSIGPIDLGSQFIGGGDLPLYYVEHTDHTADERKRVEGHLAKMGLGRGVVWCGKEENDAIAAVRSVCQTQKMGKTEQMGKTDESGKSGTAETEMDQRGVCDCWHALGADGGAGSRHSTQEQATSTSSSSSSSSSTVSQSLAHLRAIRRAITEHRERRKQQHTLGNDDPPQPSYPLALIVDGHLADLQPWSLLAAHVWRHGLGRLLEARVPEDWDIVNIASPRYVSVSFLASISVPMVHISVYFSG